MADDRVDLAVEFRSGPEGERPAVRLLYEETNVSLAKAKEFEGKALNALSQVLGERLGE